MPQISHERIKELTRIAGSVRRRILSQVYEAKGGHIGGSFSAVELLTALYYEILRIDPKRPDWEERDRFVLSKGHASIGLYTVMAERGFFEPEELCSFDHCGSRMQAHPCMVITPGVDMSTGSLGQGLSAAAGMVLAAKLLGHKFFTYVMIGDGEAQEGQIWEAAMMASHYRLDNLIGILDFNKVQLIGHQDPGPALPLSEPQAKFEAFGWHTQKINGHDYQAIVDACAEAARIKDRPSMIIADTVKGRGVSFMEGSYQWHAKVPAQDDFERAMQELRDPQAG